MNDDLKKLYEAISTKFDVGSFDDFSAKMETEDMRKSFYDTVSGKGIDLGDYEQYESRLKKKDSSMPQGASAQVDTEVSPSVSEDGQSSLEQKTQLSLEERLASYDGISNEEKIKIARQEDQKPFFEDQGLNYDDFLSAKNKEEEVESTKKTQEEKDNQASWAEKWYDRFSNWSEYNQEQTELAEKDATSKLYLSGNEEKIKAAKTEYDNALFQSIAKSSQSPEEFSKALEDSDIDSNNIRMSAMTIDGKEASINEALDYWMKTDNVNAAQDGESVNFSITVPDPSDPSYEAIKYVEDFMNRQIDSGGRFGDWGQNLLATTIDLGAGALEQLEKAPAALGMKPSPLTDSEEFEDLSAWDLYMQEGGYYANKVSDYAEHIREKTRIPEESSITKAIFDGNFDDAFFNTGNGIANAVPFTLSIALAGGGTVPLILGGASAGGMKSLELKERRRKGEDIKDWQIHFSEGVTAVSEAFFEKYTQGIINSARTAGGFKAITDPNILLDSYFQGIKKSMFIEGSSEVATEASQYLADAAVGLEKFDSGEFAIRLVDTGIISTLFGGLTYTTVRGAKDISRNLNIINDNTSVIFTNEKGETREVSRGEAINLARDPEVAQQIRDGKLKVDYSVSDVARQAIDDLVYGHSAPDAQQAKAKMFEKEKAVSSLSRKINQAKEDAKAKKEDYEVSMEDVSSLASAISEMEVEGKKSKYNVTESTRAARAESKKILDDNNIEIVDAVESQNTSVSKVTETVDATKIDSQEQYDAVKKQLEDGKRKPTVVQSQNQSGIKVNGEASQTSEITQGKFKSISAARNAMKEFEAKRDAAKKGEMLESDLSYANNKLFINTKKQNLDEIPQEVIDNNDYHVLTSEKEGLTEQERVSRMESLKSMLDEAGATYYTVQGVYNGVAEESLVVTGIDNATALNLGNQFQQESIFSSKDGLMFGDGSVVPLNGDVAKGVDARKRDALTIMNVAGEKTSIHTGLEWANTSYGKNFNSDNIHKLDESDPNHDSEVFQGLTKDRKRALGFAFKLLSSIGGLNVTVIRNSKAMEAQMQALGLSDDVVQSGKSSSFFRGSDKTIYVNLETARGNTLFHEIIHPMVDFIKKTDPALYERIEAEVKESGVKRRVMKDGNRMKGSYLEWAEANYEGLSEEGLIEEAFAEMMGDAAYGHFVNKQSTLYRIREVIREILSRIGVVSPFENVEAIDLNQMSLSNLRTDLAEALVNGRKINVGGVEFEVGDIQADKNKVNESIKFQVDKLENNSDLGVVNINIPDNTQTQEIRFQAPEFYPNFDVSKVKRGSIKEFNGQKALLMLTDRSASGMVVSPTGVKHEFDGGVFYPYQENTGVWAFSDKSAATRMINAAKESDGLVFLTAMSPGSIDGSVNMFDYVMKELDQAVKDKRATKKEVVDFLNKKMTIKSFDSKAKDQGIKTSKIKSIKEFSNLVLSMPQAFGVRKDIIRKSIQSKIFEKWGIPSMQEIYNTVNQDIIKDLKGNPIVSAIRIDTEAGYVDSRTDDKIKDHPTYPYVVKGEPLMIFDESVDASEVWDELNLADKFLIDSRTGEKLSEGTTQTRRQRKIEMARPVVDIRMQAPQAEGEANVYTSGLTTIAFNIADKVIEADYKAGKYLTGKLSKAGFDKGKEYEIRLSQLLGKPFGTHSNEEIKEIMVLSRGNLNAELLRVSENSKALKKALKGTDFTSDQINDLLHNMDEIRSMEDSEIKSILVDMRIHIDQLSRTLIEEDMIEGSTMFTVDENMGVYVRRSYKQFEVKGWEQTDNDIIKKAKEFLYREVESQNKKDVEEGRLDENGEPITLMSKDKIKDKAEVNYRKITEDKEFLYNMKKSTSLDGLNRVSSIFKEKKVIPEEIRELWGQIDNPLFNYSNTVSKLARTVSAERMFREIYEVGNGKFISNKQTNDTYYELKGSKFGSLEGKFVDEEMFAVMNQVSEGFDSKWWYNFYMKVVLFNKKMKTVWNPGTHFKNIIGNSAFATMNGHIGFRGGMYKDSKTSFNTVRGLKDAELEALYSKLVKLGVVNSSASLQEIRGIANDVYDSNFDLSEYLDESRGYVGKQIAKVGRGSKKLIKLFDDKAMSAYQAEDDIWKIFGFISEKARYIKAGLDVSTAEEMAAKNIRNLYPNYNEVPRIIRLLGRSPLVGSFVAFQAESVRNAKNTLALGFEEMGSDNSKIKKIGATRIAGTIFTMYLMESIQLYTAQFLGQMIGLGGEDDEKIEERMMRTLMPEWDASGNISYISKGELDSRQTEGQTQKDKYFDYINFSSISGVGYTKDIMRIMFNDLNTKIGKESMMDVLEKVYAPFLGEEMTLKVLRDAINNDGNKVFNPTDKPHMQIASVMSYVGNKIGPGALKTGKRIYDSMDRDSEMVPEYEVLAFFGLRVSRVNVNKNMSIQAYYVYKDMIDRVGYEVLKDQDMLMNTSNSGGSTYDSKMDNYVNRLVDVYGAGILNSIEGDDILAIFRNSRISEEVIKLVDQRAKSRYQEDYINVEAK